MSCSRRMPALPDVSIYVERLQASFAGRVLGRVGAKRPALMRTVHPLSSAFGKPVLEFSRLGKRIVMRLEDDIHLVLHLMIAGRLHVKPAGAALTRKIDVAAFDFENGTLTLTEAGSHKRAQLHVLGSRDGLAELDQGGLEVLGSSIAAFTEAITRESHTVKRALSDPRLLSGIGNAYSDEILHHARMSPVKLTGALPPDEIARLHSSCVHVLTLWTDRLRE